MNKKGMLGAAVVLAVLLLVICAWKVMGKQEEKISVYLWSTSLMEEYAPYIQSQIPEAEIEFVVGNNDLDFYEFLKENGALPDVITNRRFALHDAQQLQDQLLDLSATETAASFYTTYLENYRNSDGSVNWLPLCGEVDGIIANKALFDAYGIPMPTDYESFVAACRAFEEQGIRGFVSDFSYDYTCMEILQGVSIPELTSLEGKMWRLAYEDPASEVIGLDTIVWPGIFERMEQFIRDVGLNPEDCKLSYDEVHNMFAAGQVAMIRETGTVVMELSHSESMVEPVFLPYFGQNGEEWLLTYPAFQVALNKELEKNPRKKELAFKILNVMLSGEGQNILAQKKDVISYNKDVKLELGEELGNLQPYIDSNYLYIRLASNAFFSVSREVVQKMLLGEYDAKQAYEAFDAQLRQPENNAAETLVTFDRMYEYEFHEKGGNQAASVIANTLREMYGTDLLVSPAYNFTGPILQAEYSEKMLGYLIMPNACVAYTREVTGAELWKLLQAAVEGVGESFAPFNQSSLPVISGAFIEVREEERQYILAHVWIDGKELEDTAVYKVAYLDMISGFQKIAEQLYPGEGTDAFERSGKRTRDAWVEYIREGHALSGPSDYIILK